MGPKFYVGPHITPGKVYERSKLQKFVSKSLKMREKNISKSANFFVRYCFLLYNVQSEDAHR